MTYTTIGNQLETTLKTLDSLAVVYNFEPDELREYPALTITAAGHQSQYRTTASNHRRLQFMLRLYYPTPDGRDADAEATIRSVLNEIVALLEGNPTLNGTCDWVEPTNARILPADREVQVTVAEIEFAANALIRRTP